MRIINRKGHVAMKLLHCLFILSLGAVTCMALKCYECDTAEANCGTPDTTTKNVTCLTAQKYCQYSETSTYNRSCAVTCSVVETLMCCEKDFCNSGTSAKVSFTFVLLLALLATFAAVAGK
eukprot:m.306835 g.306835  ORF g.306835 m.306835 type:complete len:121 (+) comp41626_c0_seq1:68-430(+)